MILIGSQQFNNFNIVFIYCNLLLYFSVVFYLQDELEIEDFLWRYIEKYHADKLRSIFTPGVKYIYSKDTSPHRLEIESENAEAVRIASDEIVTLCQKVAEFVVEETFQLLLDKVENVLPKDVMDFAENEKLLFYLSHNSMCHVVGRKDSILSLKQRLLDVSSANVTKTVEADGNLEQIVSKADKANPVSGSMSDSYSMITPGGVRVEVYQGDLVDESVDAIVNPANSHLRHGSGAARAIADAAGLQLQQECDDFIRQHQRLSVTEVMHTSAGKLKPKIKHVIHAVGPRAAQFPDTVQLLRALRETFINCLQYADVELHISSVSLPAISSGTHYC